MNTTNKAAAASGPVQVLMRYDHSKQQPVVFLRDSISNGQIMSWAGGQETITPIAYYHHTAPLADKDEKKLAAYYAQQTGRAVEDVKINHRLPRVPRARTGVSLPAPQPAQAINGAAINPDQIAAILAQFPALAPMFQQPAQQATTAPAPAPAQQAAAPATNEQAQQPQAPRKRLTKKQKAENRRLAAQKAAATRKANRAKTIDTQAAPAGPQGDLPRPGEMPAALPKVDAPSVAQATPADVMNAIQALGQEFNGRLSAILSTLAAQPKEPAAKN